MTELEKQGPQLQPVPVKSSHKFATFLSYHLESGMLDELPWILKTPFKTILTWVKKHEDEMLDAIGDDELDTYFAQYADLLLQMRSDDAPIGMRVIGFADPRDAKAFDAFLAHRDEIFAELEKRGSVINEERPKELSVGDGPHDPVDHEAFRRAAGLEEQSTPVDNDNEVDDVGNF